MGWRIAGSVEPGAGRAAGFTRLAWARDGFLAGLGIDPYPGTLNVRVDGDAGRAAWKVARSAPRVTIAAGDPSACDADCWPVTVAAGALAVPAAAVVPRVPGYPDDLVELVSPVALRATLRLGDGSRVLLRSAEPPPLDAVLFDVDGTLVDSIGAYHAVAARAAAPHGLAVQPSMVRAALNEDVPLWPLVLGTRAADEALVAELAAATRRHWPAVLATQVRCVAGLAATLDMLAARGLRLGICTASRGESFQPLADASLLGRFDVVVTANDVGRRKPDPEGLLVAAARLGIPPARVAYVGDTPVDMRASLAAGMFPVGVLTGAGDGPGLAMAGAARLVASLRDVVALLGPGPA